jgi:hypothetical protein
MSGYSPDVSGLIFWQRYLFYQGRVLYKGSGEPCPYYDCNLLFTTTKTFVVTKAIAGDC